MKHEKSRTKGHNGLAADYFWYSIKSKKDRKRGIQEFENWFANVIPILDGEEVLIRASFIEVLVYRYWIKPIQKWQSMSLENKIGIIGIVISILTLELLNLFVHISSFMYKIFWG